MTFAEQSVQPEPRAARFLKSQLVGRGPVNRVVLSKNMKSTQWLLLLFAALSLVSAFIVMKEGAMPVLFLLVALIASTCAQAVHVLHQRMAQLERKLDKDAD